MRLHVRAIIRDGRDAFVGSQSLRTLELDGRREIGVLVDDAQVVKQIAATFEARLGATGPAGRRTGPRDVTEWRPRLLRSSRLARRTPESTARPRCGRSPGSHLVAVDFHQDGWSYRSLSAVCEFGRMLPARSFAGARPTIM